MSWVLLGNDDGVDSPALVPFADALAAHLDLPVRVAVPDGERSWTGKALTRGRPVTARFVDRGGHRVAAVDGTPADAVHLGLHELFDGDVPALVVTGVNIGFNAGDAFLASSGTVGGAAEATYAGVPAVAVSTGVGSAQFHQWRRTVVSDDRAGRRGWAAIAAVAARTVADVAASDLLDHCDLASINVPWDAEPDGPRSVTRLSSMRYGRLFQPADDGVHHGREQLDIVVEDEVDGDHPGDVATLVAGAISITPVLLPRSSQVPARTRADLER